VVRWRELAELADTELATRDLGAVNLACARDLPDAGGIPYRECIHRLDHYARCVEHYTDWRIAEFSRESAAYDRSLAIFRVVCMMRVLQQVFAVRYNPAMIPDRPVFTTADVFIHGALVGAGGTCASLPVVYAAVGRRLGYPLKLVAAPHHRFLRWDEPEGERFNIEINATGLNCPSDDYYRNGKYPFGPTEEREGCFLRSQTPREELAGFLADRAFRWLDLDEAPRAAKCFLWAGHLAPDNISLARGAHTLLGEWEREPGPRMPAAFSGDVVRFPPRPYPAAAAAIEHAMVF
jgi:hypothetical protein